MKGLSSLALLFRLLTIIFFKTSNGVARNITVIHASKLTRGGYIWLDI